MFAENAKKVLLSWHLLFESQQWKYQTNVWSLFEFNNKGTRQWRRSDAFIDNFEHILHVILVFQ